MTKQMNSHGLTGMTVPLMGAFFIALLNLVFARLPLRTQPDVPEPDSTQGLVLQTFVHVNDNVAAATMGTFLATRSLPAPKERAGRPSLRLADAALQRTVALASDGSVWFASLHNGNQQDGFIERVARLPAGSSQADELQMPRVKNEVTSFTVSDRGVWFAARAANLIGHILPDGTVVEYPTKSSGSLPDFPVVSRDGSVWFAEMGLNKIARLSPTSGAVEEYPQKGSLASVGPLTIGRRNDIWFLEGGVNKIGRVSADQGLLTEFSVSVPARCSTPCPPNASELSALSVGPDDDVWFIDAKEFAIGRLAVALQQVREYPQSFPINSDCLTVSRAGIVWFCYTGELGRFDPSSEKTTSIQLPAKFAPSFVAASSADDIWFTTSGGIGKTGGDGSVLHRTIPDYQGRDSIGDNTGTYLEDSSGDLSFSSIAQSPDGTVWALGGGALARFSPRDKTVSKFLPFGPESTVAAVAADHHGRVWLVEQNRLIRCDAHGIVDRIIYPSTPGVPNDIAIGQDDSLWLGLPGKIVHLQATGPKREYTLGEAGPFGLALDPAGRIWFSVSRAVGVLQPASGAIRKFALPYPDAAPSAVVALKEGSVWFTDAAGRIGVVPANGSIREFTLPSPKTIPFALSSDIEGKLWFTEFYGGKIGSFDPGTHAFREFPIKWPDSFPVGIITRPDGSLWFTDTAGVYGRFKDSDGTFSRSFLPTPIPRGG